MKSLVTGGAGFIGSHLVDALVKRGHEVVVIDNKMVLNFELFYYNQQATYHHLDVADYEATRWLYDGVSNVFHCAAESRIQPSIENPLLAVRTNVLGTSTMLQCALEAGVSRVMYSSTSSIYGLKNTAPQMESMGDDCLNPYATTKFSGEKMCELYTKLYGLRTVIFRYFNVYGPREPVAGPYAPVVGLFLRQAKRNEPLMIVGTGEQRRDFVHVNDVVAANLAAMDALNSRDFFGKVYNVGTGNNYSVKEIADMISPNQIYIDPRKGEMQETLAYLNRIRTAFNWNPTISLSDYIRESLA